MRLIENLILEGENWKYTDEGITNFLTNAGNGVQNGQYYTWLNPNGQKNEVFGILGDGNLLENNELLAYYILNRRNTNENYILSVDDFRIKMILIE